LYHVLYYAARGYLIAPVLYDIYCEQDKDIGGGGIATYVKMDKELPEKHFGRAKRILQAVTILEKDPGLLQTLNDVGRRFAS